MVLPGMTADVAIVVATRENVLLVPVSAIENGRVVIKRASGIVKEELKIGTMDGSWAEVIEGNVKATDQVVVKQK